MTARWERVKRVLQDALEQPPDRRTTFLAEACGGDPDLLHEVAELLVHSEQASTFLTPPQAEASSLGCVLADRYRLDRLLGSGGFGSVYEAHDLLSGSRVAVKVLRAATDALSPDLRREVATLRWLRLPGVVRLLDEGMSGRTAFVVMELVEGVPFPGTESRDWPAMCETATALLETISRIHWAGVIHCDLKPTNVLVTGNGVPIVLDLGISAGRALEGALANRLPFAGTPRYAAPERLLGEPPTERCDLYSFGMMLFEALTGRVLSEPERHTSTAALAPGAPSVVTALIDRLIAVDPSERPATAVEALAILLGASEAEDLPRLGGTGPVDALVAAAMGGRPADVCGGAGSGKTRALREAAAALRARGREVVFAAPSSTPFASVAPLVGPIAAGLDLGRARGAVLERARARLRQGVVLVVDGPVDLWSAEAIGQLRPGHAVLRSRAESGDIMLGPLSPEDLEALFAGPDRVHHLREDAARELWLRSAGRPAAVTAEVAAWVRAGVARREGGRLVMARAAVEQLRLGLAAEIGLPPVAAAAATAGGAGDVLICVGIARGRATPALLARALALPLWTAEAHLGELEATGHVRRLADGTYEALTAAPLGHALPKEQMRALFGALADAAPPGLERLRHLLLAWRLDDVVREAPAIARGLMASGRVWAAETTLLESLRALHASADSSRDESFLPLLLLSALAEGTSMSLDLVLYYCARSRVSSRDLIEVEAIARAAQLAMQGDGLRALKHIERSAPLADLTLERARQSVRTIAAASCDLARHREVVREASDWAGKQHDPTLHALGAEWRGWLLYREGRFREAVGLHERAATTSGEAHRRALGLLNAAWAALDGGEAARARQLAGSALRVAAEIRHPHCEARAEVLCRSAAYRLGEHGQPDVELVEALDMLAVPHLHGVALLNEAAVAWRVNNRGLGRILAARAAERFRASAEACGTAVARALALVCGGSDDPADIEKAARECRSSGLAVQALGLLGLAGALSPEGAAALLDLASGLGDVPADTRREVASAREALQWARGEGMAGLSA